jgi:hypothetical protein
MSKRLDSDSEETGRWLYYYNFRSKTNLFQIFDVPYSSIQQRGHYYILVLVGFELNYDQQIQTKVGWTDGPGDRGRAMLLTDYGQMRLHARSTLTLFLRVCLPRILAPRHIRVFICLILLFKMSDFLEFGISDFEFRFEYEVTIIL